MQTKSTLLFVALLMLGFLSACSSNKPKVDWDSRVGNYTYDQAVAELGPPDKTTKISEGKTVAAWIVGHHSSGTGFSVGTGTYSGGIGVGVSHEIGSGSSYDRVLTLTFDADNRLLAWKKNY